MKSMRNTLKDSCACVNYFSQLTPFPSRSVIMETFACIKYSLRNNCVFHTVWSIREKKILALFQTILIWARNFLPWLFILRLFVFRVNECLYECPWFCVRYDFHSFENFQGREAMIWSVRNFIWMSMVLRFYHFFFMNSKRAFSKPFRPNQVIFTRKISFTLFYLLSH